MGGGGGEKGKYRRKSPFTVKKKKNHKRKTVHCAQTKSFLLVVSISDNFFLLFREFCCVLFANNDTLLTLWSSRFVSFKNFDESKMMVSREFGSNTTMG